MWEETFDINVRGTFLMSKYAIPRMLEKNYGCIVNNSSILGLKATPAGFAAYAASQRERSISSPAAWPWSTRIRGYE